MTFIETPSVNLIKPSEYFSGGRVVGILCASEKRDDYGKEECE